MPFDPEKLSPSPPVLQMTDLGRIAADAFNDILESADLVWRTWVQLFPNDAFWNPLGAALTLIASVGLIVWLVRVRPG